MPILKIVSAIDQVARLFLNPAHSLRKKAESALMQACSREMAQFIIEDCFSQLTSRSLLQFLEEELGDPLILDTFRPKRNGSGATRAYGPRMITHILPGNIPSISVISLVCALLVKSSSIAKISAKSSSVSFPTLFVEGLQSVDETLAQSITLTSWEHGKTQLMTDAFHRAELVILYGSDQTIETLRPHIPREARVIVHGPKVSLGIVAREEISRQVAQDAAWDIALYDQHGCLSPHLYYLEVPTGTPNKPLPLSAVKRFAQWVSESLDKIPLPKGPTTPEQASAIQQLRGAIPLKGGTVFASKYDLNWTVFYDPDPEFVLSPLGRTIFIKPIKALSELGNYLKPIAPYLQAVGIAVGETRTAELLNQLGS